MYFKVRKHHSAYLLLQRIREGIKAKPARNGSVQPQYSLWITWILILQDSQETAIISVKLNPISLCLQVRYSQHMNPSFTQMKLSKNPSANSCHPLPTEPGMIPSLKDRNIFHSNSERACTQSDKHKVNGQGRAKRTSCSRFPGCLMRKKELASKLVQQMEQQYSFSARESNRFELPTCSRMPGKHQTSSTTSHPRAGSTGIIPVTAWILCHKTRKMDKLSSQ